MLLKTRGYAPSRAVAIVSMHLHKVSASIHCIDCTHTASIEGPLATQLGIGEQCHVIMQQKLGDHCRNTCHEHLSIAVIAHGLSVRLASVSIAAFLCQNLCYRSNVMTLHRYFEWCHGIRELSLLRHCEIRRMVIRSDRNRSSSSIATMMSSEQVYLLKR